MLYSLLVAVIILSFFIPFVTIFAFFKGIDAFYQMYQVKFDEKEGKRPQKKSLIAKEKKKTPPKSEKILKINKELDNLNNYYGEPYGQEEINGL